MTERSTEASRDRSLEGRVCVISGVGPGVGRATAELFAREGAIVVAGARNVAFLDDLVSSLRERDVEAMAVPTDISDGDQCTRLVDRTVDRFGRIDVLVNNAGFRSTTYSTIEKADFSVWQSLFDVNLFGTLRMTQCAIPALEQAAGSIVFLNTMIIRKVRRNRGDYAASRAALLTASHVLARELGPRGIRVNSVLPGWIWGESVKRHAATTAEKEGTTPEAVYDDLAKNTALRRLPTPEDIAEAIVFLASDRARAITGQTLDVNGGEVFA